MSYIIVEVKHESDTSERILRKVPEGYAKGSFRDLIKYVTTKEGEEHNEPLKDEEEEIAKLIKRDIDKASRDSSYRIRAYLGNYDKAISLDEIVKDKAKFGSRKVNGEIYKVLGVIVGCMYEGALLYKN